jgi:hypothetical protein
VKNRWFALASAGCVVLCALFLLRTLRQLAAHPEQNWDMLPAMALALEWEEHDPLELHRRTYAAAQAELPPATFQALTSQGVTRVRAQDAAAFHEHLAFYRARALYSLSVYALHRLGAPLSAATVWVSIGSWTLLALLALLWAARYLPFALAALLALGLAHTPALLNQAGTSSADGLATLLTCAGAWAVLERRRPGLAAVFFLLALGARTDTVILLGLLSAACFLVRVEEPRPSVRALALFLAGASGIYVGLGRFAGEYGWWPLMQISFIEKSVHPSELPTAVDWSAYFGILERQLASLPGEGYVTTGAGEVTGSTLALLYGVLAVLGIAAAWPAARQERRYAALLVALLVTYVVRFPLFPQLWDRFLAPVYVLVPLCLLAILRTDRDSSPRGRLETPRA